MFCLVYTAKSFVILFKSGYIKIITIHREKCLNYYIQSLYCFYIISILLRHNLTFKKVTMMYYKDTLSKVITFNIHSKLVLVSHLLSKSDLSDILHVHHNETYQGLMYFSSPLSCHSFI